MSDTDFKMDPEFKAQWLEALRSGRYPQGRGALRREGYYCCLGVLADVIDPTEWDDYSDTWMTDGLHLACVDVLPDEVQADLVLMNDTHGLSFQHIANWIEENL